MTQDSTRHIRDYASEPVADAALPESDRAPAEASARPQGELLASRCAEALDALIGVPRATARKDIIAAFQRVCLALGASRMWLTVYRESDAPEVITVYETGSPRWRADQMGVLRKLLTNLPRIEVQSVVALTPARPDIRVTHEMDLRTALFDGVQAGLLVRVEGRMSGSPRGVLMMGWPEGGRDMVAQPLCHALVNHAALLSLDAHLRLPSAAAQTDARLSSRESECLRWAAAGKTSWETAQILAVRERTVNFHLGNAFGKLNVNNKQAAVARALMLGLLGNMEP